MTDRDEPATMGIMNIKPHTPAIWWFLDDEREPILRPDRHWVIFRTGEAMVAAIAQYGLPAGISFDHDLGEAIMAGHDVAKASVDMVLDDELVIPDGFTWLVHSQNPIGAKHIDDTMGDLARIPLA